MQQFLFLVDLQESYRQLIERSREPLSCLRERFFVTYVCLGFEISRKLSFFSFLFDFLKLFLSYQTNAAKTGQKRKPFFL